MADFLDCACVIHSDGYSWQYVENLYNMLQHNSERQINFHVFTEKDRAVPETMIRHDLVEWPGIAGPKKSWWYKMQLFDPANFQGQMLYFDLDVVIVDNIDWIARLDPNYFWAIHDFKYLWRPTWTGINSSIMYWNTQRFAYIWDDFVLQNIESLIRKFHGDQDYIGSLLTPDQLRYFNENWIKSWRWQLLDGGIDPATRTYNKPNSGTALDASTKIMIFHGHPKPHEISDRIVQQHWCRNIGK